MRVFAVIGFSFLTALMAGIFGGTAAAVLLCCAAVVLFLAVMKRKRLRKQKWIPVMLLSAAMASCSFCVYTHVRIDPLRPMRGESAVVTGRISDLPYENGGKIYYTLDVESIDTEDGDHASGFKMIVSMNEVPEADLYDRVELTVRLSSADRITQMSKGILLRGTADRSQSVTVTPDPQKPLYYYVLCLRANIQEIIREQLPEREAGLVTAVMTMDRSSLYEEDMDAVRISGLSHIIAVSGFHLSVLTGFLMLLFLALSGGRKRLSAGCCLGFVLVYMALTGLSAPVVRAGVMQIVILTGILLGRERDSLNSLGLSVLVILLPNPYAAADLGFLLSVTSTLGILLYAERCRRYFRDRLHWHRRRRLKKPGRIWLLWERFLSACFSVISVSVCALLFTLPVLMLYFRTAALYAVLANLLITPLLSALIAAAFGMILLTGSGVLSFLALPFTVVSGAASDLIFFITGTIASFPFAALRLDSRFVFFWLVFAVGTVCLVRRLGSQRTPLRVTAVILTLSFLLGNTAVTKLRSEQLQIETVDTGDGLSVILAEHNRAVILACGGEAWQEPSLSDRLSRLCPDRVSCLLLLSSDPALSCYAGDILSEYPVDMIQVWNEETFRESVRSGIRENPQVISVSSGNSTEQVLRFESLTVSSFREEDCIAAYAEWNGYRVLMLAGGTDCENLPNHWKSCDVLIVSGTICRTEQIKRRLTIISDTLAHSDRYPYAGEGEDVCMTGEGYHISIQVGADRQERIRRESNWQS